MDCCLNSIKPVYKSRFVQGNLFSRHYNRKSLRKGVADMADTKAMIALSGGVDSSVAAHLILKQGISCVGATMQLRPAEAGCGAGKDIADARSVAEGLGIPYYVFDFQQDFQELVIEGFAKSYEAGLTPNPCIGCNRYLKFDRLLEQALALGCDYIVTGHYAQVEQDPKSGRYLLKKAVDTAKDQSYFLYGLTQHQLAHTLLPLGSFTKERIREIAQELGLVNAKKHDSQDICFIPDGDYKAFLEAYRGKTYPHGNFLDETGKVVGTHGGTVGYTLGQRKGLGLAMGAPVYVCAKDMQANTVTVGPNEALYHKSLLAADWNWFPFPALESPMRVLAKVRSRQAEQPATAYPEKDGRVRIEFDDAQRAITPGQAVVLYHGDYVIGGGTITEVL